MTTINLDVLAQVTGGTNSNDAILQSMTTIQTAISNLANNNNSNQSSSMLPMVMMMAMNRR